MRDGQVATFLGTWGGFARGVISSNKLNQQSSLSAILETGDLPQRYFLSRKACAGILRRAERRGKELPTQLRRALKEAAEDSSASETHEDKTS